MRLAVLTSAIVLIGAANGAQAAEKGKPLDDAQCKAAWTIVSPNGAAISKDKPVPWSIRTRTQSSMLTSSRQAARPVG
jgi:hypothetical protein